MAKELKTDIKAASWERISIDDPKHGDEVLLKYNESQTIQGKVLISSESYLVLRLTASVIGGYYQKSKGDEITLHKFVINKIGRKLK